MVSNVGSKWHLRERMVVGAMDKLVASDTSSNLVKGEGLEWQQDSCRCRHRDHSGTLRAGPGCHPYIPSHAITVVLFFQFHQHPRESEGGPGA